MDGEARSMWIFQPHAAEETFEEFVKESAITIYRDEWLDRAEGGVKMKDGEIESIRTLSGEVY